MLRFFLGRIPVEIHFRYLLVAGLLSWSWASGPHPEQVWPGSILNHPDAVNYGSTYAAVMALWALIITVSVLVHELGHALAWQVFGYRPSVHLIGLINVTRAQVNEELPWAKDAVVTLAGPLFGLALGVIAGVTGRVLGPETNPALLYTLSALFTANVFWAVVNLMPVAPLDGGRLSQVVLLRLFGRPGFLVAQGLAMVTAAAVLLFGLATQNVLLAILFGWFGARAVSQVLAYRRGEVPMGRAAHPLFKELAVAEQQFNEGHVAEAAQAARRLVDAAQVPEAVKSRAHHLLGWVALKVGQGRLALDHFHQVTGLKVLPHALAEAYSLIGDEPRALRMWEEAAQHYDGPLIRVGLAAALIRSDRESDARKIPEIRLASAYDEAARIFEVRNEFTRAATAAEGAFQAEPGMSHALQAARYWSKAKEVNSALRMLALAVQNGFADPLAIENDTAFAEVKRAPEFENWLTALKVKTNAPVAVTESH